MRTIVITKVPEKTCAEYQVGPYKITLRQKAHTLPQNNELIYELATWCDWTLMAKTNWRGWHNARREFERAKRHAAITLAKLVLFNEAKPEDQDNE